MPRTDRLHLADHALLLVGTHDRSTRKKRIDGVRVGRVPFAVRSMHWTLEREAQTGGD